MLFLHSLSIIVVLINEIKVYSIIMNRISSNVPQLLNIQHYWDPITLARRGRTVEVSKRIKIMHSYNDFVVRIYKLLCRVLPISISIHFPFLDITI